MTDLFTWLPPETSAAPPAPPPEPVPERIWLVRDLSFTCPGCAAPVFLPAAPSNQILLCARCRTWGTAGHRQMRALQAELEEIADA